MTVSPVHSLWRRSLPAVLLMCAAPLVAEVLPGATRFSAIFVLPIEICVWGGGALLIREATRRWHLGWCNLLFLALALAVAEECLIQQTSLAPMVLQLKGQVYARAYGVNYVYFLWALVYEVVFVVFIPIYLVELIFPQRRQDSWVSRGGLVAVGLFFVLGSFLAWFTWTQIARLKVFHVPAFTPPLIAVVVATFAIASLLYTALGRTRSTLTRVASPLMPPSRWLLGAGGAGWAVLWFGLVLLGFGAAPSFPPWIAITTGLLLAVSILLVLPRWAVNSRWDDRHRFAVIFGTMFGSMLVSFIGFIGAASVDLYFKIVADIAATGFLVILGRRVARRPVLGSGAERVGS